MLFPSADISKIDFGLLRRESAQAKKKNVIAKDLQDLVCEYPDKMLLNNPNRTQYHERHQSIIEDYNSQQNRANIGKAFDELMKPVQSMDQEEQRYVREGFPSDEELSLCDMLFSIRDTLWSRLPERYDEPGISSCRQSIYEYVYTSYKNAA